MALPHESFCPYAGLEPYTESQREYFFGRERDQRIVSSNLYAAPLTILYGASGAGKSSVLMAGVVPHLRLQPRTAVVLFRNWQSEAFLSALKSECLHAAEAVHKRPSGIDSSIPLDEILCSISKELRGTVLVIFDQFEEYFLYHSNSPDDNSFDVEFARSINRADVDAHFLISLREDQLSRLDHFRTRIPNLLGNIVRLRQLDLSAAEDAIRKPIDAYNSHAPSADAQIGIEDDLVTTLLADENMRVGHVLFNDVTGSGQTSAQRESARIETPLLQLVMIRLWNEEHSVRAREAQQAPKQGRSDAVARPLVLQLSTLIALGGVRQIVRTHLDGVMTTRLSDTERQLSARMFQFLVTPHGAKIAHATADLVDFAEGPAEEVKQLLEKMDAARILRRLFPPERYEIFHDVLAPAILDWRKRFIQFELELKTAIETVDYIVVGSGAGGGTVAARLAEAGRRVLLLEAGGDPLSMTAPGLPEDYQMPALHAFATENAALRWDFFVGHFADRTQQQKDPKFVDARDGVLYPRAGALGGCTATNAMILMYPTNHDWDEIAMLTGDESWRASNMRRYVNRLEDSPETGLRRWIDRVVRRAPQPQGWLSTEQPTLNWAPEENTLVNAIRRAVLPTMPYKEWFTMTPYRDWFKRHVVGREEISRPTAAQTTMVDVQPVILSTRNHARTGSRERVMAVLRTYPDNLRVELNALVTRVLFDDTNRAIGVEYLKGQRLYRAHSDVSRDVGERRQAFASREVILCGGAFNTPQLLMLSGIGPAEELQRHGIRLRVHLPGVGRNLQDRYEISLVNRLTSAIYVAARVSRAELTTRRAGISTGNGYVLSVFEKLHPAKVAADRCVLVLFGRFTGYFHGFSQQMTRDGYLTWVVGKSDNRMAGRVTLRSADPRDTPLVQFNYFSDGSDDGSDLAEMVEGIKFARVITHVLSSRGIIAEEETPGAHAISDAELRDFIRSNAWGQHAACSCPIGRMESGGVVGSDFRVHGTRNLRVVDASVFPRLPGFFIAGAVYMIGEKAADVILKDEARVNSRPAAVAADVK